MKNLENYGVQDLNTKEIKETEGGWLPRPSWSRSVSNFNFRFYVFINEIMP